MPGITPFIEVLRFMVDIRQVRVGNWILTQDRVTGEGFWEWDGKSVTEVWYEKHPSSPLVTQWNQEAR